MNVSPPFGRPLSCALLASASLFCLALLGGPMASRAARSGMPGKEADPGVLVVTTDSRAYCRTLASAIDAHGALPREVADLESQGRGLCEQGRVRGGIVRLRRALLMLHTDSIGTPGQR